MHRLRCPIWRKQITKRSGPARQKCDRKKESAQDIHRKFQRILQTLKIWEACAAFVDNAYEQACLSAAIDPWNLRDDSVELVLDGVTEAAWLKKKLKGKQTANLDQLALLLRAERDMLRAQASDAWFFEEFNRIEPRNAIRCAAYALWLTRRAGIEDARPGILPLFKKCASADGKVTGEQLFLDYDARLELTNQ